MSKKDLSVLKVKKNFKLDEQSSLIYFNFKKTLNKTIKIKSFLVAVSGGPDSLALTALSQMYKMEKNNKVYFVLIDHGIRSNSTKEANLVKKLLIKKKINLSIIKNKEKIGKNIQNQARKIRYDLLLKFCKKKKIKYMLTAHHSEDQIETFFIRLSRGSGVQGLSSMSRITKLKNDVKLLRPLLDLRKSDLLIIAKKAFGKIFKDPSNVNKKYLRTRIRSLKKKLETSGIKHDQIIKSINNLASTRDTLNKYTLKVEKSCVIKKNNKVYLKLKNLSEEPEEIVLRIIGNSIKYVSKNYYPPRSAKILNIIKKIKTKNDFKVTLGSCLITRKNQMLCLDSEF